MTTLKHALLAGYARLITPILAGMTRRQPILFCGENSSRQLCHHIAGLRIKRVLLVTDRILNEIGALSPVASALEALGIGTVIFDEVSPDPTYDQVRSGATMARQHNCDAVLAIGGGSSMDCAKGIAACMTNSQDISALIGLNKCRDWPAPLFVVPTTAGTGSEVSPGAVLTDPENHSKGGMGGSRHMPLAAALDPVLMASMPPSVTAASGLDALTHAIEAYISRRATEETYRYAMLAIHLIFDNLPRAYTDGKDLDARSNMAIASTYAGLAFAAPLVGYVHAISHRLGERYHVPHGLANAVLLPHVLEISRDASALRLAEISRSLQLTDHTASDSEHASALIDAIKRLCKQLEIPETLDLIKDEDIPMLAKTALQECHKSYAPPRYLTKKECAHLISLVQA